MWVVAVLLLSYTIAAVFLLNAANGDALCHDLNIVVKQSSGQRFITADDVIANLRNAGLYPVGKPLAAINTGAIETRLKENKLIKQVDCYKTAAGNIGIEIDQKIPILRVLSLSGNYYIDSEGEIMPVPGNTAVYVPVATGYVERDFARTRLYHFALFLQEDRFWNNQIEQICIAPNNEVELVPRVGDHRIVLGKLNEYKENLEKLRLFYEKGLKEIGWNKYSVINLKFKNQVVCVKKNNE